MEVHIPTNCANHIHSTGAVSGSPPEVSVDGSDTNIDLKLRPKGTGVLDGSWHVLAASAVAASHTGNTNETTLATVTIPANAMGPNGIVRITAHWSMTNNANNKTGFVRFNGTAGTIYYNLQQASIAQMRAQIQIANRNAMNSQVGGVINSSTGLGTSATATTTSAVDTTAAVEISIRGQLANAADAITLESYIVELLKRA